MKKIILSVVMLAVVAGQGFGQGTTSKLVLPASQYNMMKKNGQLKPDVYYIPVEDHIKSNQSSDIEPRAKAAVHPIPALIGSACSCLIPNVNIDPTFTIGHFVGGVAPEYRNDDSFTASIALPFTFCLYGTNYTNFYLNNNGNITFNAGYGTFTGDAFPSPTIPAMIAPFWGDVDTRNLSSGLVYYKITPTALIIQWYKVGYFNSYIDKNNTFQLIITDGSDAIIPPGNNVAFCYGDMQWTTGDASGGSGGFGGTASTVGVNKGDGISYIQMGRFDQPGVAYDGGYGLNDGVSWLDGQSMYFNVCNSTNLPPLVSGFNNCDTIHICGIGDTLYLNGLFLSPEAGQTTTVTADLSGAVGATVVTNTPGNTAYITIMIVSSALNYGNNLITLTATDNGSPIGTSIVNVNVFVDTTGLAAFNPVMSGNLEFCEGGSTVLTVAPSIYDQYVWSTGVLGTSITVNNSGLYYCTVKNGSCYKSVSANVIEHPNPTPLIAGYPFTCGAAGTTLMYCDSLIYQSYTWCCPVIANDSANLPNGTYTLTVTDTNGCTGVSPPVNITGPAAPVITGQTAICNGANAWLTTTYAYVSYLWTPSALTTDTVSVPADTYTVQVVDINGCTLNSAPFTVSPFNYTLGYSGIVPYCAGQSITVFANSTNTGSLAPSYTWLPSGVGGVGHIFNAGGTDTLVLTFPNGCTMDTTFTVPAPNPLPTPTITGPNFTCGTTPTILTVVPTYPTYVWSGSASTSDTAHVVVGIFQVTVTDVNGCVGTSNPDTVFNANPTVAIVPDPPPSFCPGDSLILTANTTFPGATYLWSNGGTASTTTVTTGGTYIVTISYSNGCTAADTVSVTAFNGPTANFSETPPSTAPPLTDIQFTDLSTGAPGPIVYWVWNFGDGTPLNQGGVAAVNQNPIHQYGVDGTYHVVLAVRDNNGCWDTGYYDYLIVSSISLPNVFTPHNGGPDGVNAFLYFKNLEFFPNTELQVYNRWGTKIYENKNYHNDWNGGTYTDGTYYYILSGTLLGETKYGFVQMIK